MTFGSLFAGIGGFDLGFERNGMRGLWQVEIDSQCQRVLSKRFPLAEKFADVAKVGKKTLPRVDVICGGFPCQDLSVAGQRKGLQGGRSGLFFEFARIVKQLRPELVIFENVPGLLSSNGGRDPLVVLRVFADLDFHGGWRVLDSQYFGVAQRRDRIFGVFARGRFGAGRAAEILAVTQGGGGDSPKGGEAKQAVARTLRSRSHSPGVSGPGRGGEDDENLVVLNGHHPRNEPDDPLVVGALQSHSKKHGHAMTTQQAAECGHLVPQLSLALNAKKGKRYDGESFTFAVVSHALSSVGSDASVDGTGRGTPLVAYTLKSAHRGIENGWQGNFATTPVGVRRLMPVECLRLQAFPDDWLDLSPPISDSAKYRMIGNAVTVSVAEWLGHRMEATHA